MKKIIIVTDLVWKWSVDLDDATKAYLSKIFLCFWSVKESAGDTRVMFILKYLVSDKNQVLKKKSDCGSIISVKDMDVERDDSIELRSKIRLLILSD